MWNLVKWNPHFLVVFLLGAVFVCQVTGLGGADGDRLRPGSGCLSTHFRCANGRCVSLAWVCDGQDDCHDKSDEQNCTSMTCAPGDFRCVSDGSCIPKRWTCDKDSDCSDSSDESPDLCKEKPCGADEFRCGKVCIKNAWRCDGDEDCDNGEDEQNCNQTTCKPDTEFQCKRHNQCISARWRCDRTEDCMDGSDEEGCSETHYACEDDEFKCSDNQCIQKAWACDGDKDCEDGSDELDCVDREKTCRKSEFQCRTLDRMCIHMSWMCDGDFDCEDHSDEKHCNITCKADQFLCEENYCIHESLKCDGQLDCMSGSDETNCPTLAPTCSNNTFDCHGDGSKCVPYTVVCDGWNDCGNYEDERTEKSDPCPKENPCLVNNGGCQHICYRSPDGVICDCHVGFELDSSSKTECVDVNECLTPGTCSQNCINTKGSFKCRCESGYELIHNTCTATEGEPELLLADRKDLRRYNLYTKKYTLLIDNKGVEGAIAMDYQYLMDTVFWTDVSKEQIMKVNLKTGVIQTVVSENVSIPDGLAVDWVHGNMYWTDTGLDHIEVASLDGSRRKVLIKDGLDEPRAIAVHPGLGMMVWTDWGLEPKIEGSGLNGKDRMTIISQQITWPNGLTIDYVDNRLYWIDAKTHIIGSSDLDGGNRRLILRGHQHLGHPFAITVFEDFVYWSDWPSESIRRYNKFQKGEVETIAQGLDTPMDIHILHPYRQLAYDNRCGSNTGGCQQFCLPTRLQSAARFTCECQKGYMPDPADSTKCVEGELPTPTAAPTTVAPPATPKPTTPVPVTPKPSVTTKPAGPNTTPKVPAVSSTSSTTSTETVPISKEPEEGLGHVAVIVIAVVLLIAFLVIVVGVLVFRRYRKRNIKSMNFDNPVYRKTTMEDDKVYMEKTGSRQHLPSSMQPLHTDAELA